MTMLPIFETLPLVVTLDEPDLIPAFQRLTNAERAARAEAFCAEGVERVGVSEFMRKSGDSR